MERLREVWSEFGFENVRTYVQSGNVVFEAKEFPPKWSATVERRLAGETRLPVSLILRTPAQFGAIIAANPFLKERGIDNSKLHVTFLAEPAAKEALGRLGALRAGTDRLYVSKAEVYLRCPNGYGGTKLSNNALEKVLAVRATTRNWNTVNRLYGIASE